MVQNVADKTCRPVSSSLNKCEQCEFMSKNNNELNAHIRAIHSKPEPNKNDSKRLPCGICKKYFYKKAKLIEHRRTTHDLYFMIFKLT